MANFNNDEDRKAYQKDYYRKHKEKALAYQRAYTKLWRKSKSSTVSSPDKVKWQGIKKEVFSASDLTQAPTARFQRQIELILSGQMGFVL